MAATSAYSGEPVIIVPTEQILRQFCQTLRTCQTCEWNLAELISTACRSLESPQNTVDNRKYEALEIKNHYDALFAQYGDTISGNIIAGSWFVFTEQLRLIFQDMGLWGPHHNCRMEYYFKTCFGYDIVLERFQPLAVTQPIVNGMIQIPADVSFRI